MDGLAGDMETVSWVRFALASLAMVGLMAGFAFLLRFLSSRGLMKGGQGGRTKILSVVPIDPRRRVILLRHDRQEHLILLGPAGDLLLSSSPSSEVSDKP